MEKEDASLKLDDTPNLRTCIVNTDIEPGNFETITVDILQTTIKQLTEKLVNHFGYPKTSKYRIRNLEKNMLYCKEELDQLLKCFMQF